MSASIHNMCSTPDYGCVHVVADNQYQGKIEGWNDPFWKWAAWTVRAFSGPIEVTIDKKVRLCSRESYIQFLSSIGIENVTAANVDQYKNLNEVRFVAKTDLGEVRQHLVYTEKARSLGVKMFRNLVTNGFSATTKAYVERMLAKGADPLAPMCVAFRPTRGTGYSGIYVTREDLSGLHSTMTPFLYAALNRNEEFCDLFRQRGAEYSLQGKACSADHYADYYRQIEDSRRDTDSSP